MIHVPGLKHEDSSELFLGLRIWPVRCRDFAVPPIQSQRGFRRLKGLSASSVSVCAQMVVVLKAFVEHCVSLVLGHARVFCWLVVSQTDVFHISPYVRCQQRNLRTGLSPYSRRAEGKSTAEPVFYFHSSSRPERKRRSGSRRASCPRRASAFSYEARASEFHPSLRHKSARAACARWYVASSPRLSKSSINRRPFSGPSYMATATARLSSTTGDGWMRSRRV
jgi:hypothetical protein